MGFVEEVAAGGCGDGAAAVKCFPVSWGLVGRLCNYCNSNRALLFCRNESAYMCMTCDTKAHVAVKLASRHERVWMCEVCEQAPASVTCKADAAALCVTCDRDIHSANPLASRHERIPVVPFYGAAESVVKSAAGNFLQLLDQSGGHDHYETGAWNSTYPTAAKEPIDPTDTKSIEFLFSEPDNYLDFEYPFSSEARLQQHFSSSTDGIVPVQTVKPQLPAKLPGQSSAKHFEIEFTNINHSHPSQSFTRCVSSTSLDVGVVPEGSSMSEIAYPFGSSVDLSGSSSGNQASQVVGMDREARVLRYRERRKSRKFEKTIRYASRKAYAERRPRIKGRFAKRSEADGLDVNQMFSSSSGVDFFPEQTYGVVPTF